MSKSSREKVFAKIGKMVSQAVPIPTSEVADKEMPRNRGSFYIDWEKKVVDGKKVISYCCGPSMTDGNGLRKEFTDKTAFLAYVKKELAEIPGESEDE